MLRIDWSKIKGTNHTLDSVKGLCRHSVVALRFCIHTVILLVLSGCLPLWNYEVRGDNEQRLQGVWSYLQESSSDHPVRMLYVHGMGVYPSMDYAKPFASKLTQKLGLTEYGCQPTKELQAANNGNSLNTSAHNASLMICDYSDAQKHTLRLYVLLWSPLTESIKSDVLGYDSTDEYSNNRILINKELKSDLVNSSLSDPLLYLSPAYKLVLQSAMKEALCFVANENGCAATESAQIKSLNDSAKLFIVTESLGSTIMYDTLKLLETENDAPTKYVVDKLIRNSVVHYMFANQLPLLCLGRYNPSKTLCVSDLQIQREDPNDGIRDSLAIVAFSDPNDLLSYPLRRSQFQQFSLRRRIDITNVILNVEKWAWLFIYVDPRGAHTNHRENSDVLDIIACGIAHKRAATCKN